MASFVLRAFGCLLIYAVHGECTILYEAVLNNIKNLWSIIKATVLIVSVDAGQILAISVRYLC